MVKIYLTKLNMDKLINNFNLLVNLTLGSWPKINLPF
jgi:hypothetical protein